MRKFLIKGTQMTRIDYDKNDFLGDRSVVIIYFLIT